MVTPGPLVAMFKGHGYFRIGLGLLVLFVIQQAAGLHPGVLAALQADDLYKQLSGFTLFGFIAYQWYFSLLRVQKALPKAACNAELHKQFGVLAPLLFFFHSLELGHAYQMILSLTFFTVFLTGLFNPETTNIRGSSFRLAWTVMHVGMATLLPFVITYHVFITYWFE